MNASETHDTGGTQRTRLQDSFATPRWLRDLGRSSWLLVGLLALLLGLVWLLAETYTITGPMVCAIIVSVVAMPVVRVLDRHMPNAVAAALVLIAVAAIAIFIVVIVVAGITGQSAEISAAVASGVDPGPGMDEERRRRLLERIRCRLGREVGGAPAISTLMHGLLNGIRGLASVLFGLSFAALGTFFLLKDGQQMRRWVDRHVGLPEPTARVITGSVITSLRGYFRGVTIVAAFNGVVVGLAALLLNVPLAGTIAVVSFVTAYVPVHRRVRGRHVRRPDRARSARDRHRDRDARRRPARERAAAEPRPAVRDGLRAPSQSARRARGHDRRRLPVRDAGARARRARSCPPP